MGDVSRLKKAFEANPYEAEQLLKEVDIHSVAGTLKLYLRDLTESLVTTPIYLKMFEAFSNIPSHDSEAKKNALLGLFSQVPHNPNQACVVFLIEHIVKVSQCEQQNKMCHLYLEIDHNLFFHNRFIPINKKIRILI